jgi:DNA polymerase-3 subunit gamma/tau
VLRLAAAAALPPPEDAMKLLAAGAAVSPPKSRPEAPKAPAETPAPSIGDVPVQHHEDEHHGLRLSTMREIIAELEAQRQIDLRYDIEKFVRPAEVDFGHFRYTAGPGTPSDLSLRVKNWLEATTGVEWEVLQSGDGAAETISETRKRKYREKIKSIEALPRIAEALRVFPGAQVLRVEEAHPQDELDETPAGANVIHVDFAPRDRDEGIPDPEEREDDD